MKKILSHSRLTLLSVLIFSSPITIQAEQHHSTHSQEAHVHGVAELNIVLENNKLEALFHSPAMNLIGFEHKASTKNQKQAVKKLYKQLSTASQLFTFINSHCSTANQHIDVSSISSEKTHHDHSKDDHNKTHNNKHGEIEASYQFNCKNSEKISAIDVKLLGLFPGIETLQVQWIINQVQGATSLSGNSKRIHLR